MKKTLMVLTFALCATVVFAQTVTSRVDQVKASTKSATALTTDRSSSIFTKDDVVLATVDFSDGTRNTSNNTWSGTGYNTGIITTGVEQHGENYDFAVWQRWANIDEQTLTNMTSTYPALVQNYFSGASNFLSYMPNYLDTSVSSAENGFMMMSMYDQRTRMSGNFNAFIQINNIDASEAGVVDVRFYQYYRKYYDYCYMDYTTNGTTWNETEINVRGIDVSVNGALRGFTTYTLPVQAAGNSDLSIRIRYKALDRNDLNAYGYFWVIDDVSVLACPANRLKTYDQEYVEGNYGLIPQTMQMNPSWYATVLNNGGFNHTNANVIITHLDATQTTATELTRYNNGTLPVSSYSEIIADPHGWMLADSLDYRGWYGYIDHSAHGSHSSDMPTSTLGTNYMVASIATDSLTVAYDTMFYHVTDINNGSYRWGHDNGVLFFSNDNHWLFGWVEDNGNWFVTENPDEVHFYESGYTVTTRYTTDATVPAGWVIRGIELVASPVDGFHSTGSKISAVLIRDEYEGNSVYFQTELTGANVKEIEDNDVNDSTIINRQNGFVELGEYNTVVIDFPEQPALLPNTSYRVGYTVEEESYFAVAQEAQGYYVAAAEEDPDNYNQYYWFANNEATAKYAHYYLPNVYQNYIIDPSYGGTTSRPNIFAGNVDFSPMIRLLVGPEQAVQRVDVSVECDSTDYGSVSYGGEDVCGTTIHPVLGSTATLVGYSSNGCEATVYVDGNRVEPYDPEILQGDPNLTVTHDTSNNGNRYIYNYSFANISGNHTIRFSFSEQQVSIDPVAQHVHMNLQPNPATSQVKLNIEGVNGMVNCTLIDMSGRVVYNQDINAEAQQTINLSNLAKGAYFVRITNNEFSKVEKLIVR